jgi:hypothetical protein
LVEEELPKSSVKGQKTLSQYIMKDGKDILE